MELGNITKTANFKSFLHLSSQNTQLLFVWTVLFDIFTRQTLTDDFGGLHTNMNCAFPLIKTKAKKQKKTKNTKTENAKETKEEKGVSVKNLTGYDDIVCRFALCTFKLLDRVLTFSWLLI